ncbi:MAG: ABC transporter ATP-binding protein [Lachnospiraceae bacterium]|nr:ABC transporter ATP-binding protein [Lachnospiraceae bacterium]
MANKSKDGYLSRKEIREISRYNRKITSEIENKNKRKNVPESEYVCEMKDSNNEVEFDNVHTYFFTDAGTVKSVDGVTFDIPKGKTVGVVGESGCGKSVTSLSLMKLLQRPQGQIVEGAIRFNVGDKAIDVTKAPDEVMQKLRGNEISMIFQEPMTALNPVFRIGEQVDEVIELHDGQGKTKEDIKRRTIELLQIVGIANTEGVYQMYPHELSGGMRQRIVIAMALACNPKMIIADEPTTALDVTIQAQILELLKNLKDKINASIMFITHDLGVIAEMADYVVVMYAGRVVEQGTAEDIFYHPAHPYTIGLMDSKPVVGKKVDKLYSIPGKVPNPINMPNYCYFKDRCEKCIDKCDGAYPSLVKLSDTHMVSCYRYYEEGVVESKSEGDAQ